MAHFYKNELGHIYHDYIFIAITNERVASNGCIKWLCKCKHCGETKIINGNALRFGQKKYHNCGKE